MRQHRDEREFVVGRIVREEQARAHFGDALKLDDKIGDLKGQLAGLPEFSDATGIYALPLTIQGFPVYYNKKLYADAGLDPAAAPRPGTI